MSLIFRSPFWATLPSDNESQVELVPMTYRSYHSLQESAQTVHKNPQLKIYNTQKQFLVKHILDTNNIDGFPDIATLVNYLPRADIDYLYTQLIEISQPTQKHMEELSLWLDIQFDPIFSDENWDCSVCQEKGFDVQRACGFLPEAQRIVRFKMKISGRTYTICPKSTIEPFEVTQAATAHKFYDSGNLPEDGSIGNQTIWFVRYAQAYQAALNTAEHKRMAARNK